MPQLIPAAAAAAAQAVSGAVYSGLTAIGVSTATAATVSMYAASITIMAVTTAAYIGPALLFRPNVPTPEQAREVRRQAIPDRVSGYGRARLGGARMLQEVAPGNNGYAVTVDAMHDGLIDGWEQIYLHDDKVTVTGGFVQAFPDLRYGKFSDLVQIETRRGLPTETAFAAVTALLPTLWPANARGDNVASLMQIAKGKSTELFRRDYPFGHPKPSAVGRLQLCWDPRLGARGTINTDADKEASATWAWTENYTLHLLDYMTNPRTGMGLPVSRFLARIDTWEASADACDADLDTLDGPIPKYHGGGAYLHSTAPADVIATILASFDGWLSADLDGNFVVEAGVYTAPTVVITEADILEMSIDYWREDEQATNEMVVSYTDPLFDYTEVETDAKRNEDDITQRGGVVRSQRFSLPWVQHNVRAQYLGKIAVSKSTSPISGTVVTTLAGLRAWGERRIRLQSPSDGEQLADLVVDILPITINPNFTVSIPFVATVPSGYSWDPETDQGTGSGTVVPPPLDPLDTPVIDDVEVIDVSGGNARLRVVIDSPEAGLTYVLQWQVDGETGWHPEAPQESVVNGALTHIDSGTVTAALLNVQVARVTAGGRMTDWSVSWPVDATVVSPMGQADNLSAYPVGSGAGGQIAMTARAPVHPDADHIVFLVGTTAVVGAATPLAPEAATSGQFANVTDTTGAGTFYVWAEAEDVANVGSGPVGPVVVVVPA